MITYQTSQSAGSKEQQRRDADAGVSARTESSSPEFGMAPVVDTFNGVPLCRLHRACCPITVKPNGGITRSLAKNTPRNQLPASVIASQPSPTPIPNHPFRIVPGGGGSVTWDACNLI